ncbi:uncharacterized protein LOC127262489 [Andrographis paniculata]|uniref:uncharacterized protein LOC127262489 n=1 Tax=Andrographis paniculata TaxID=175694 RepID=UPI0021E8BCA2|nr:uncharacterized protein LOC127262489 [Andrographis paniculata]
MVAFLLPVEFLGMVISPCVVDLSRKGLSQCICFGLPGKKYCGNLRRRARWGLQAPSCTKWLLAAQSVRKASKHPWLMFIPKSHDLCEFHNPTDCISYYLKVPAMKSSVVYYCKDDWILYFRYANFAFLRHILSNTRVGQHRLYQHLPSYR